MNISVKNEGIQHEIENAIGAKYKYLHIYCNWLRKKLLPISCRLFRKASKSSLVQTMYNKTINFIINQKLKLQKWKYHYHVPYELAIICGFFTSRISGWLNALEGQIMWSENNRLPTTNLWPDSLNSTATFSMALAFLLSLIRYKLFRPFC